MSRRVSRRERLREFFDRLGGQPPSLTAEEALARVIQTLDEVEDAYSGVAKQDPPPPIGRPDGRMYPPQADRVMRYADGGIRAETKGHEIIIGCDGSVTIRNRASGATEFHQAGSGN